MGQTLYYLKMDIKMVDLKGQYLKIKQEVDEAMMEVIENTAFINGPQVGEFAKNLGAYLGTEHVLTCANGTDAIQIALMALDLPKESEIIVPGFNYVASAEVICLMGHKPVFVDSDIDHFNLIPDQLQKRLTSKTRAVIAVHLFGQSTDMEEIATFCEKNNLILIEDNAQAIGGEYSFRGKKINNGLIGDIGTTSFFPSKNLGCFGDGGAVYTKHSELHLKMQQIANHGQSGKYNYEQIGINSRLDTLQAALLNVKLKRLDDYIEARRKAADFYDSHFKNIKEVMIPFRAEKSKHVFHQYTLKVNHSKRDRIRQQLQEKGIPTMVYYPSPLHLNKAYGNFGFKKGDLPNAEQLSTQVISLPMHTELDIDQLSYICETFTDILKN